MENQVLSIEQMQELLDLGIDISTASMFWIYFKYPNKPWKISTRDYRDHVLKVQAAVHNPDTKRKYKIFWMKFYPTFTLQDILEILPNNITIRNKSKCRFSLEKFGELWLAAYIYGSEWEGDYPVEEIYRDIPIEAAFEMLKWCKQNNYI